MSDHRGLPHDLPLVKARVYKYEGGWHWGHQCAIGTWMLSASPLGSWLEAFQRAYGHMERCA